MAFPCIGMLAQSSARWLREARDLSTVASAAIKGAASLGLRWANLDWDQAVPICRFGGGWNSQGACYQLESIWNSRRSTLVAELPRLEVDSEIARWPLEVADPGCLPVILGCLPIQA